MKQPSQTTRSASRRIPLLGLLLALFTGTAAAAENETLVALGRVSMGGALTSGTTTIGGAMASSRPSTGEYVIEITSPGAFAGAIADDFLVQATINWGANDDKLAVADVVSLSDDVLEVEVLIGDVEDATNLDSPQAWNRAFHFAIHRVPLQDELVSPTSRHLFVTGAVASDGTDMSGFVPGGGSVSTTRIAAGHYEIVVTVPGGLADDFGSDYVMLLTPGGYLIQDEVIRGTPTSTISDDVVVFHVFTDEAQDEADDDNSFAIDKFFFYTIYRMNAADEERPQSGALLAAALYEAGPETLTRGALSRPGGTIHAVKNGTGAVSVFVEIPGYFADRASNDFIPQLIVRRPFVSDELASGTGFVVDDDTYRIDVGTSDVEESGSGLAVSGNESFCLLIHEAFQRDQSDLHVGKKRKLRKMRGDNRYNRSGAGQRAGIRTKSAGANFFFALENDGNRVDDIRLRRKGKVKGMAVRYFRLTGGRRNITAKVFTSGYRQKDVAPEQAVLFQAKTLFEPTGPQRGKARVQAFSQNDPGKRDVVKATVKKK